MRMQSVFQAVMWCLWFTTSIVTFGIMVISCTWIAPITSVRNTNAIVYLMGWGALIGSYWLHDISAAKILFSRGVASSITFDLIIAFNVLLELGLICCGLLTVFDNTLIGRISGVLSCCMSVIMFLRIRKLCKISHETGVVRESRGHI